MTTQPTRLDADPTPRDPPATGLGLDPDKTVVLIDGSGYIFRAYYAIRKLTTGDGRPTNAVFGFTQMLLKTLKDVAPRYLGIAFDPGGKNFRHEMYPAYKANRPPAPEDLPPQIPWIHRVVDAFRIPRFSPPGWEADDVLGTLTRQLQAQGMHVVVVTGDKDLMQLVDDDVSLLDELRMQKGGGDGQQLVRREQVIEKFGVEPGRVIDVLALCGDASDNVPGVKGIGPKTATELVQSLGDLEKILASAATMSQKSRRERLLAEADQARLSRALVTIRTDAPVQADLGALRYEGPDPGALRALFQELEFKRLLSDPLVQGGGDAPASGASASSAPAKPSRSVAQPGLPFAGDPAGPLPDASSGDPVPTLPALTWRVVTREDELVALARDLEPSRRVALHVEYERAEALQGRMVGLALSWAEGEGAYVPFAHPAALDAEPDAERLGFDRVRDVLGGLLADPARTIVAHQAKDVLVVFEAAGFPRPHLGGDPMLADYLLDVDERAHDLESLCRHHLHRDAASRESLLGKGKSARTFASLPLRDAAPYAVAQAELAARIEAVLAPRVEARELGALYRDMELPLSGVLARMELAGVKVDVGQLGALAEQFDDELRRLEERAYSSVGEPFNLGSPQQVAEVLFERLKLPVLKRTKTGASTDASVLEELAGRHELPALILEHRQLAKLKNTYVDVLPTLVHPATGRVHTTFNQAVAATGRLSSQDPNLQNIPIRTGIGRQIRRAFIAEPGHVIASLDYSQIELRILAHVTQDPVLVETFQEDEDVHTRTASEIFDVSLDQVTREQRTAAKSINFGLLYGMGVLRLARELGIERREAKAYLEKYFARFAGVRQWQNAALERARELGEVRTLFGRRRLLPQLASANRGEAARAERLATNTPIQGSAADLIKRAMIVADADLAREVPRARMILQVHDELVVEVPREDADAACEVVRRAMQGAAALLVPLRVDAAHADNWAAAH